MKFLFEIGDILTYEKWIAEQSVEYVKVDVLFDQLGYDVTKETIEVITEW